MTHFDVNSLFVKVGKKPLLSGVSFHVTDGHILSFSGQNGSGKTSLLKVLSGLCIPSEGEITYSKQKYQKIFFSNEPQFISNLTALKNIELYTIFYNVPFDKEKFLVVFEKYLPLACASLLVNNLSTGQRRLLSFVLIEILKSDLIFLDEPTHGLDQNGLERFLQMLEDIKKRKSSIFFIATHDKSVLARSDEILNVEQYKYIPSLDASSLSLIISKLEL